METWLTDLTSLTGTIAGELWGIPAIVLLVGTGIYLTFRLRFIQFRGFKHAIALVQGRYDKPEDEGEISHFQALSTALSVLDVGHCSIRYGE